MVTAEKRECASCGYANATGSLSCGMCGGLLEPQGSGGITAPRARELVPPGYASPAPEQALHPSAARVEPGPRLPAPLLYLAIGAAIAPLFAMTPILQMAGWFLGAICHESGHSLVAWFFGMPAIPAISLGGHAASVHQDQMIFLVLMVWGALAYLSWQFRAHRAALVALGAATLLYPLFAFTDAKEFLHLVGGHCGELAIACVFFWRAMAGGFSSSKVERALYAVLAWYLMGCNVDLCWGLSHSAASRAWYAMNGSFGLTNDYIRLAHDVLGWRLTSVAWMMLFVSCLPLPMAVLIRRKLPAW